MKNPTQKAEESWDNAVPPQKAADAPEVSDVREETEPAQAEKIVRLVKELFRLGQTMKREPFAVMNTGPHVMALLGGSGGWLRDTLSREYRRRHGKVMNQSAFSDALSALRGEANECEGESCFIRVGPYNDGVVLDLGTASGEAVVVDKHDWRIVKRSPILFQRTALTAALPIPQRGGNLDSLRTLLNVTGETWPLLLGWMVAALIPEMPHPILMLGGQQGTGKTTAARFICGLFDPSDAPVRSQPTDPEAWAMSVANGWATVIDNVSVIPGWWSDALCKVVTGDGWVRRTHYTNSDVSVLSFRRVVVLTSIEAGALRGDLGERLLLVDLEAISREQRKTERVLDKTYQAMRPSILGALLDLLVLVLQRLDAPVDPDLPRMADFSRVLAAIDASIGTNAVAMYADQATRIAGEVLDADPVGEAILRWFGHQCEWRGSAAKLLSLVKPNGATRDWPRNGKGFSERLRRLAPALALQGIKVTPPRATDRTRTYTLSAIAQTAQPPDNGPGMQETEEFCEPVEFALYDEPPGNRPGHNGGCNGVDVETGRSGDSGGPSHDTTNKDAERREP